MSALVRVTGGGGIQIYDSEMFTVGTEVKVDEIIEEYLTETGYEAVLPIHFLSFESIDGGVLKDWIAVGEPG